MSNDTDADLVRKWGAFQDTWAGYVQAEKQLDDKEKTLSPADFDSWRDWLQISKRKMEAHFGGPYTPSA